MPRRIETQADVRALLDAGRDLSPGQVATLIGSVTRFAVDYWLVEGLAVRGSDERWIPGHYFTPGGHRKVYAAEVRKLLELVERQPRAPRKRRSQQ